MYASNTLCQQYALLGTVHRVAIANVQQLAYVKEQHTAVSAVHCGD
jgi:hypothetical protein